MATIDFDSLKGRVVDLAQCGVAKTIILAENGVEHSKKLMEVAKLKASNLSEEEAIKKAYQELGKIYYEEHFSDAQDELGDICERITASKAVIETNNDRLADLKNQGDDEDVEVEIVTDNMGSDVEEVIPEEEVTADDLVDEKL